MEQAYTYTDLQVVLKIDPSYCVGTLRASFEPSTGEAVEVTTSTYNTSSGEVTVSLTQAQTAKLFGVVAVQLNGFKSSKRWASKKCYFQMGENGIARTLS